VLIHSVVGAKKVNNFINDEIAYNNGLLNKRSALFYSNW
jgi:hypothetical protein